MKEAKIKTAIKTFVIKVKESVPFVLFCTACGIVIGGSATALHDSKRITKLEKRMTDHVESNNNNVDIINDSFDNIHDDIGELAKRVETLTRQNNELLERALRETEGKAS